MATAKGRTIPIGVNIAYEDYQRIISWCKLSSPKEVGGMAVVEDDGIDLNIMRPTLLDQEVGSSSVELAPEKVLEWLHANFTPEEVNKKLPNLHFCLWHSHPTFAVGFSVVDEQWIADYITRGWLVSLCVNNAEQHALRVDTLVGGECEDTAIHQKYDGTLYYLRDVSEALEAECKEEFARHVKVKKYNFDKGKRGKHRKGGHRTHTSQLPYGDGFPRADVPFDTALMGGRDGKGNGEMGGSRLSDDLTSDPMLWRCHLDKLTGAEYERELAAWRHREFQRLGHVLGEIKARPDGKITITFNETGSITVCQGSSNHTIAATEAGKRMLVERLGVGAKQFKGWLKSGVCVAAHPGPRNNPDKPLLVISNPETVK